MDKKLLSILTLAIFSGTALAGMEGDTATSAIGPKVTANSFENLDADNDNYVSKSEVSKVVNPSMEFNDADADRDGKLNLAEYRTYINETHSATTGGQAAVSASTSTLSFESLDANKDGTISRSEYGDTQRFQGSATGAGAIQGIDDAGQDSPTEILIIPVPPGADALVINPAPGS
jgi:hypothetical protein